jgi:hypothetical protein
MFSGKEQPSAFMLAALALVAEAKDADRLRAQAERLIAMVDGLDGEPADDDATDTRKSRPAAGPAGQAPGRAPQVMPKACSSHDCRATKRPDGRAGD